jgi:hypothetical protein
MCEFDTSLKESEPKQKHCFLLLAISARRSTPSDRSENTPPSLLVKRTFGRIIRRWESLLIIRDRSKDPLHVMDSSMFVAAMTTTMAAGRRGHLPHLTPPST